MSERGILFSAPIVGYEALYLITRAGVVASLRSGRQLAVAINNCGYATVLLRKDGKTRRHLIHRLVAQAFVPNLAGKPFVNHRDGNKLNNADSNLEWVTQSENEKHAFALGLKAPRRGIPLTEQTKAKLSAALKGRPSPRGFAGKRRTSEAIAKFQASMAARRARHA